MANLDYVTNPENGDRVKLVKGYMYRIGTRWGQQRLVREHLLTFLDRDHEDYLIFNARPKAGTQMIYIRNIVYIVREQANIVGTYDNKHYMNKIVREPVA